MALPPIAVTEVALGGISRYYNISDCITHIQKGTNLNILSDSKADKHNFINALIDSKIYILLS